MFRGLDVATEPLKRAAERRELLRLRALLGLPLDGREGGARSTFSWLVELSCGLCGLSCTALIIVFTVLWANDPTLVTAALQAVVASADANATIIFNITQSPPPSAPPPS